MKKNIIKKFFVLIASLGFFSIGTANAVLLSLSPSELTVPVGSTFSIDLNISGLTAGGPDSVGGFETDIHYDPLLASFTGYDLGTYLGDPLDPWEIFDLSAGDPAATGSIDLWVLSLLFDFELDALQPDAFTLATLNFQCIACGQDTIHINSALISDAWGIELPLTIGSGTRVTQVPEPSIVLLFAAGILGFGFTRRQARS